MIRKRYSEHQLCKGKKFYEGNHSGDRRSLYKIPRRDTGLQTKTPTEHFQCVQFTSVCLVFSGKFCYFYFFAPKNFPKPPLGTPLIHCHLYTERADIQTLLLPQNVAASTVCLPIIPESILSVTACSPGNYQKIYGGHKLFLYSDSSLYYMLHTVCMLHAV